MEKDRPLAFSDGVIAIIITIMVLELKVPHMPTFDALLTVVPVFVRAIIPLLTGFGAARYRGCDRSAQWFSFYASS
jgi:uncharacterized membrane protein